MRIRDGFLVKKIMDEYLVVPVGNNIVDFAVAVSLNESGAFLWEQLKTEQTSETLVSALMAEYEGVEQADAERDVADFLALLNSNGFLCEA